MLETCFDIPITLIGTGPKAEHIIDLRYMDQRRIPIKNIHKNIDGFPDAHFSRSSGSHDRVINNTSISEQKDSLGLVGHFLVMCHDNNCYTGIV